MRFRTLGPLRVRAGAGWVPVRAHQRRVVLAVLLAEAGQVVSTDQLVDGVWGERPPRSAVKTMHGYVMRLRRLLGDDDCQLVCTRGSGYELVLSDGDVDEHEFERLVAGGRRELDAGRLGPAADRLTSALALWRGPALADVPPIASLTAHVTHLEQARLAAVEDRLAALLGLGRSAEMVVELSELVDRHPLREPLWAYYVTALHQCGRRGDALDAYQRARRVLVAELGLEPGPELRELQRAVLADAGSGEPAEAAVIAAPLVAGPVPSNVVPAQLPPDVRGFAGRIEELGRLDAALLAADGGTANAVVVSAIAGTAGVGKTALAVHWAHRVRGRFGDGQLYVDLRGHADGVPVPPLDALTRFLRVLGVPGDRIPSDVDEASALYRSYLVGKRVLVLLDNAYRPEQVRPLLPSGRGCLALVTSRDRLGELVARDGAVPLRLDVLTAAEARDLLVRVLGHDRVQAESEAAAELARLCDHLPLALRFAAANLAGREHTTIAEYASLLSRDRLDALEIDGDPHAGARSAFGLSYEVLPEDARLLFRRLGLVPGPDVTAEAAAALAGVDAAVAARLLRRLDVAHLVQERAPGRYSLHDLLRRYAAERAQVDESESERRRALDGIFGYYLRYASAAADVLHPEPVRLPHVDLGAVSFGSEAAASAWMDAERPNLVAAVTWAAQHGPPAMAWRLADALRGYFYYRPYLADWQAVAAAGLAAAEKDGDELALAAAHLSLGSLHLHRDSGRAVDHYTRAAAHARRAGWPEAEAGALKNIGGQYLKLGQLEVAADHYSQALATDGWASGGTGEAGVLYSLGSVLHGLGRLVPATEHLLRAAASYRRLGLRIAEARVNGALGIVYHAQGRLQEASDMITSTLATMEETGDRYHVAFFQSALAELNRDLNGDRETLALAESADAIARAMGEPELESIAATVLAGLHHHHGDPRRAVEGHRWALALARDVSGRFLEVDVMIRLASAHRSAGEPDIAAELARQALDIAGQAGYRLLEGQAMTVLAAVHYGQGNARDACNLAERALRIHTETGHRLGLAQAHLIAGRARHAAGDEAQAQTHESAARALFADLGADHHAQTAILVGDARRLERARVSSQGPNV